VQEQTVPDAPVLCSCLDLRETRTGVKISFAVVKAGRPGPKAVSPGLRQDYFQRYQPDTDKHNFPPREGTGGVLTDDFKCKIHITCARGV